MNAFAAWAQAILFEIFWIGALKAVLNHIQKVFFAFARKNQHFGEDFLFAFLFLLFFFKFLLFLAENKPIF